MPDKPGLSRVGEIDSDILECGDASALLTATIAHLRWRARVESSIARESRQAADEAAADANIHSLRAREFEALADELEGLHTRTNREDEEI